MALGVCLILSAKTLTPAFATPSLKLTHPPPSCPACTWLQAQGSQCLTQQSHLAHAGGYNKPHAGSHVRFSFGGQARGQMSAHGPHAAQLAAYRPAPTKALGSVADLFAGEQCFRLS